MNQEAREASLVGRAWKEEGEEEFQLGMDKLFMIDERKNASFSCVFFSL
jgi:hypothetical protein